MILLTGITGNNGGATANSLLEKGIKFRALVRDLDKAAAWADKGVELVKRYSNPSRGRHSIQIEINKALYMNEATNQKNKTETLLANVEVDLNSNVVVEKHFDFHRLK